MRSSGGVPPAPQFPDAGHLPPAAARDFVVERRHDGMFHKGGPAAISIDNPAAHWAAAKSRPDFRRARGPRRTPQVAAHSMQQWIS
jgi:hypothetical protein